MMDTYIKSTKTAAPEMQELHVKDSSSTSDEVFELYRYNGSTADLIYQKLTPGTGPTLVQAMTGSWSGQYQYAGTLTTSTEIVFDTAAGAERWGTAQLRLWNGSEAGNAGATQSGSRWAFASGSDCRTWWDDYAVRVNVNAEGWQWINVTNTQDIVGGSCQPTYINTTPALTRTGWTDFTAGLSMDVEVWKL